MGTSHKLYQFETLRGLAALWVFASHVLLIAELWPSSPLSNGNLAVDVFVLLSGFVIGLAIERDRLPYRHYLHRRIARLYPMYIIALALGLATAAFYGDVVGASLFGGPVDAQFVEREDVVRQHLWAHFALHLTMMHGAIPDAMLSQAPVAISGPLWSISLEWQFYLVAPILVRMLRFDDWKRLIVCGATLLAIMAANRLVQSRWEGVPSFLPLRLHLFAIGIVCCLVWPLAKAARPSILVTIGALSSVLLALLFNGSSPAIVVFGLIYTASAVGDRAVWSSVLIRLLSQGPLRWIGERSYGLYVLHMPVLLAIGAIVVVPFRTSLGQGGSAVVLASSLVLTLVIAHVLFVGVERPAIALGKRLTAPSPALT